MPTTEYQGSSVPLAFLGRSILSLRRNQVSISMETHTDADQEDLELFQKHISDRFLHLSSDPTTTVDGGGGDSFLSIGWLRNLLDVFLCCEAEFKAVLILGRDPSHISKPPLDRLIPDLLDRAVKALDVCNAVTNSIESILHWQKLALIAVSVLEQNFLGEGQLRRAKKALNSLLTSMMIGDKDGSSTKTPERTWSFGRRGAANNAATAIKDQNLRSFSWGVSKNWSASKQIQAMSANLVVPRGSESTGLALPVYIMSTVLVFVMWVFVTAIPCQDRTGLANHFQVPRQLSWTGPIIGLQDRISDEWKKKEKKGLVGLLDEIQRLEKCSQALIELADTVQFPVEAEQAEKIKAQTAELAELCRKMEDGLVPLQRQVREVFHRIVRSRSEVIDLLEPTGKFSSSIL